VDTSRSMAEGTPPKIEFAKSVAAALGYIGLKSLDRVGGATFSSELLLPLSPGRGRRQILKLFQFLGQLSCAGATELWSSMRSFSLLFPQPGLVILVSDLLDPQGCRAALEELANKKYELLVIHILDESEIQPRIRGDLSLLDVESERERRLFLDADLARRFQEEFQGYLREVESFCLSRRIDYLRTTTATPFEDFVLLTLRRARSVK